MIKEIESKYKQFLELSRTMKQLSDDIFWLKEHVREFSSNIIKIERVFAFVERKNAEFEAMEENYNHIEKRFHDNIDAYHHKYLDMTRLYGEFKKESDYTRLILEDIQHVLKNGQDKPMDLKVEVEYPLASVPKTSGGTRDS